MIQLCNKEITENGTYKADSGYDGFGQITVNVASSGGGSDVVDSMLDGTITEINSNATTVVDYACYGLKSLVSVNLPKAARLGANSFYNCSSLALVNAPKATYLSSNTFRNCTGLKNIKLPSLNSVPSYSLSDCTGLTMADFPMIKSIAANSMTNTTSLEVLILRKTDAITTLSNTNAFTSSAIANGTGYIYVPRALIDTYKTATNWKAYASQFRVLEDYTVDGTTTGEFSEGGLLDSNSNYLYDISNNKLIAKE